MWRKGKPSTLLVGLQTGAATVESSLEFSQKTKNVTAFWPSDSTAGNMPWESQNTNSKEVMHPSLHSNIVYNCQDLETAEMHISSWVDKKTMLHLHNGILHSRKKERIPIFCDSMECTREYYAKWSKPGSEKQVQYDLTYKRNLMNKINMRKTEPEA